MWGVGVNVSNSTNTQISNAYNESKKYVDQSVKDTMIQNYISNITTRNEDVNELVKNFENNVSSEAEAMQKNTTKFAACVDIEDVPIKQTNELIQNVKQGFQKLNEDVKKLKKVIDTHSDTTSDIQQDSANKQGASAKSEQEIKQEQDSKQTTEQKAEHFGIFNSFNSSQHGNIEHFANLNKFNRLMSNERFGIHKPVERVVKRRPLIENFNSLLRENYCFIGCVDVNVSNTNNTQTSNSTNIDFQSIDETQDIYKKIETAYDKTVETINRMSDKINDVTNSVAKASSIQINEFIVENEKDACMLKLKNMPVEQANKLEQNVELSTAIQSINELTSDSEIKAIMVDMLGLTQKSETQQDATTEAKQTSDQKQKNVQETKQTSGNSMGSLIVIIIIVIIIGGIGFMIVKSRKSRDSYFDAEVKKKSSEVKNLSDSVKNIIF